MTTPIPMDAELASYLLERKLRSVKTLFEGESSSYIGAIDKISHVINILEQIGESARIGNRDHRDNILQENVNEILATIRSLDDVTDKFLLRRANGCTGYHSGPWSNSLIHGLRKFEKRIRQIFPAAASARAISSPNEPLPNGQPRDDWSSIRQESWLDWDKGNEWIRKENDKAELELFSGLVSQPATVLILRGRRATGKTMLTRYLYKQVDIIKAYNARAWVSVHENLRYKDVLLELIEQVGVTGVVIDHTKEEDKLAQELFKLLSIHEHYLIVLDNCNSKIWPKLMECLPEKNGRVVITTTEHIGSFMKNQGNIEPEKPAFVRVIEMAKLKTPSDRWEFLCNLVKEDSVRQSVEQLKANTRGSSPRASVLLAGALNTQRRDHIPRAIEAIKANIERAPDRKMSQEVTLKWSYQDLHPLIKACFLFLSIFPKGIEVPFRRAWYSWLSEGFLDDDVTNRDFAPLRMSPKHLARTCLGILVNRKLVEVTKWKLEGSPKAFRIPISVHDFAAETLQSTGLFSVYNRHSIDEAAADEGSSVRRLACHGECIIPTTCLHRDLRAYVSFHTKTGGKLNKEIEVHLKMLAAKRSYLLLKMLDLEGVYKPKIPDSIGNLLYLRYLGLRSTLLDSLPTSIGKLERLETLDLKHTHVINLPSFLLKSKKLRHLHAKEVPLHDFITEPYYECLPSASPKWQKPSSNLETLTGLYIRSGKSIATGSHMFEKLQELDVTCDGSRTSRASSIDIGKFISGMPGLQSLKLNSTDPSIHYSLNFSGHKNLEKIYLCCKLETAGDESEQHGNEHPPHPLSNRLPPGLRELTLSMSGLKTDPMKVLGKLDCLVVLKLLAGSYLGGEMECERFPSLRVLKLWKLPQLVTLNVKERSLPCLEEMEIRNCPRMREIVGPGNLETGKIKLLVLCDMPREFEEEVKRHGIRQKTTFVKTSEEN